jgi:hypothetical protein
MCCVANGTRKLMTNAWIICHFTSMANTAKKKETCKLHESWWFFCQSCVNVLNVQSCVYLIDNNTTRVSCKRQRRGQPFLVSCCCFCCCCWLHLHGNFMHWDDYCQSLRNRKVWGGDHMQCSHFCFVLFCFFWCLLSPPFPINWVVLSTEPQIDYVIWFWKFWSTQAWGLPGADDVIIFPIQIVDECKKVRLVFPSLFGRDDHVIHLSINYKNPPWEIIYLILYVHEAFFFIKQTPWNKDNVPFWTMYNTIQLYQGSFSSIYVFNTN